MGAFTSNRFLCYPIIFLLSLLFIFQPLRIVHLKITSGNVKERQKIYSLPYEFVSEDKLVAKYPREKRSSARRNLTAFSSSFIRPYIRRHNEIRKNCESIDIDCSTTRLLVYGDIHNVGIGDRIRGIMFSFIVASFTDRLFLLNITDPYPIQTVFENGPGINLTYDETIYPISSSRTNETVHSSEFLDFKGYDTPKRVVLSNATNSFDISLLLSTMKHINATRAKKFFAKYPGIVLHRADVAPLVLRALFAPSLLLRKRIARREKKRAHLQNRPYIGVHARFGKGIGEHADRFNVKKIGLTLQSASLCFGRSVGRFSLATGTSNFFLSTDTRSMNEIISMGIKEVVSDASVAFAHGKAMHISMSESGSSSKKEKWDGFVRAFVDVSILGGAAHIISLKSGFADFAAWLGVITDAKTVDLRECPEAKIFKKATRPR